MFSSQKLFLGQRSSTFDHPDSRSAILNRDKMIREKVLNDERKAALATTVQMINDGWLDCKECNWYKADALFTWARLGIQNISILLVFLKDPYSGWTSIRKFPFNDELNLHMLHYQQVRNKLNTNWSLDKQGFPESTD